ncbi:MAG: response regulator [Alphaproteobacteria bacterium]|nr:response regulator [Alphaproteobacteria bacterium]MCZ6608520.1 response regulator [Alphaproteobacteria bacterium]MCZ6814639.1 response regulator [Alphaproteobacteria bacterium]
MAKKLLIVDDEADFANFVLTASEAVGYEARVCNDCAAARETLKDFTPDLMVLDIVIPGEDGIEFLNWFSSQSFDTKVILVTGFNTSKSCPARYELVPIGPENRHLLDCLRAA